MKLAYYPGCTLRTKAKELDRYAREAAEVLGVELCEIPEWQCCGGAYTTAKDEIATKLSSVRALAASRDMGSDALVTVCSACYNVLKQTNHEVLTNADMATRANNYMKLDTPYTGETKVIHYLELLRDVVGFDKIAEKVTNPLKGKKVAAYYGCLLLRPGKVLQLDDPENPRVMEDFIRALGGEPVISPMRNECCGGYITLEDKGLAKKRSTAVTESAKSLGADVIVTACPLCLYNLTKNSATDIPTVYFTDLLAEAMGLK
ncbi:MAG: disulfide reductase [Ruminococcaceae bacterium]|nr:disulfide reductase [Oscillospiraceae bacterium]